MATTALPHGTVVRFREPVTGRAHEAVLVLGGGWSYQARVRACACEGACGLRPGDVLSLPSAWVVDILDEPVMS